MKESITLRALDNIMSNNTMYAFAYGILFLIFIRILSKHMERWKLNKWLLTFISGWTASILVFLTYYAITFLISVISSVRFGTDIPKPPLPLSAYCNCDDSWLAFLITHLFIIFGISLLPGFIYMIYSWLTQKIIVGKLKFIPSPIVTAIAIFILFNIVAGFLLKIMTGADIKSIILNMAIWIPGIAGIALAFLSYEYYLYAERFKIQEKELQIAKLQKQVTQSQLDALSSKINPHFLYNSLNAIAGLAIEDGLKTREMAIALSKLFKYNINRAESSFATIKEEMEMVSLYLEIEQIRFEERLQYISNIQPGIENELIPMHLLQPLVENAVKHGAGPDGINIIVSIKKQDNEIMLSVQDKGKAFDTDFNPGYGLKSLYDKLDILAPGKYEIAFLNDPKEVSIKIKI